MARLKNIIPARYANFTIYVGEDDTEQPLCAFRVSRERLRFKSEIWEGKIQAALERGAPYCWFTEDNPDAIGIILNVIHGNPEANPYILNREVLFQVAESSARHGVVRALREFIRARSQVLLEGPEPNAENHARSNNFEQRIYISWIFGQRIPFAKAMTELINNMIISDDNYITMFPGLERIDLHYLPEGAAGKLNLTNYLPTDA
jgi:hypothetical protein